MKANVEKATLSGMPLSPCHLHWGRQREMVEIISQKDDQKGHEEVVLERDSRGRVQSSSEESARIHRVTVGVLPSVKSTNPKKVAGERCSLLHSDKSHQPNKKPKKDWKE